jgi:GYF domain 2
MPYQVSRNGQTYGPYTLEDLQRYVASGNIAPTDLAKSEDMPDWLPISQILNVPAAPGIATQPYMTPANYPTTTIPYPDPPNLHWALLLLFGFLTCGIFTIVYDVIQTLWVKKIAPTSQVLLYYVVFMGLEVINLGSNIGRMSLYMHGQPPPPTGSSILYSLLSFCISISVLVMFIVYRFAMRSELERHFNGPEPIGLRLSGVMTFFFGGLYFQYHFNRINEIKQNMRYRGAVL